MNEEQDVPGERPQEASGEQARGAETPSAEPTRGSGAPPAGSHEELLLTLQDAREQAEAHWNELLRARADLANLQRRAERDVEQAHRYGLEKFVNELLPVMDSLELGLDAASGGAGSSPEKLREGMELTLKLLTGAVGKFGVQPIEPQKGDRFDPGLHQAMSLQPAEPGGEANRIVAVYQKGYLLNERLVRPAMVVVSGPPREEGAAPPSGGRIDEMA